MSSPSFEEEPLAEADHGFVAAADHHEPPQQTPATPQEPPPDDGPGDECDDDDDNFEFAFVINDPESGPEINADEIFSNGFIRPIYPVLDRALLLAEVPAAAPAEKEEKTAAVRGTLHRLLIAEREENSGSSSSSSSSLTGDELEGIPPGTYCVWAPRSPVRCKKSCSTGTPLRWWLRDLVVRRSHSDGKEKFVFLAAEEKNKNKVKESPTHAATGPAAAEKRKEEEEEEKKKAKGKGRGRAAR